MIQTSCAHHRICSLLLLLLLCSSSNLIFLPSCWRLVYWMTKFYFFCFLLISNIVKFRKKQIFPSTLCPLVRSVTFFSLLWLALPWVWLNVEKKSVCCYDREFLCLSQTLAGVVKFSKIEKKRRRRRRVSATFIPNLWTVKNNPLTPLVKGSNKTVEPWLSKLTPLG